MTARHIAETEMQADDSPERFAALHAELSRLPGSFREPLVLCYLDGLTHEQAAAQLRCPIGTVQSRLARKDKVAPRLEKRGIDAALAFPSVASSLLISGHFRRPGPRRRYNSRCSLRRRKARGSPVPLPPLWPTKSCGPWPSRRSSSPWGLSASPSCWPWERPRGDGTSDKRTSSRSLLAMRCR